MDAVLKHLGLRSDFIVCHPGVIDDPLSHARRPPPCSRRFHSKHTHTRTRSSLTSSYSSPPVPPPRCTLCTFTENFKH